MIILHGPPRSGGMRLLSQTLPPLPPPDLHVCWGTSGIPRALNASPRLDALEQLGRLQSIGIPTPQYTTSLDQARSWAAGELVFGRMLLHTHGADIVGPRHPRWPQSEWWSLVVRGDALQEWRIHVVRDRVIGRGTKYLPSPANAWRTLPVRSRGNGWRLRHDLEPPQILRDTARAAVRGCGYDFGAVDMLYIPPDQMWVLEVNRQPGLSAYTAGRYAAAFVRIAGRL